MNLRKNTAGKGENASNQLFSIPVFFTTSENPSSIFENVLQALNSKESDTFPLGKGYDS